MYDAIKVQIKQNNLILFIGAGVPATLGLPTWADLVSQMAKELDFDPKIFKQCGDYLTLAEYYSDCKGHIGELRDWMSRKWAVEPDQIRASNVYKYITEVNSNLIYTTNFEHSLETAFKINGRAFKRIIDVRDLVNIDPSVTQIVKFHGDVISDESIVLTESDYFRRLDFESPLDIKLRSDMLGKSILFVGYSLSDINIRLLIYKLDSLWKKTNQSECRPKSYIFLPAPNPVQEVVFKRRGILPIIGSEIDPTCSLEKFLKELVS